MRRKEFRAAAGFGHGGAKCPCCAPQERKAKRAALRTQRRRLRVRTKAEIAAAQEGAAK